VDPNFIKPHVYTLRTSRLLPWIRNITTLRQSINLPAERLTVLKDDKASEFKGLTFEGAGGCNSRGNDTQLSCNQLASLSKFLSWSHVWEYFDLTQMQLKLLITHWWHCSIPVMINHQQNQSLYTKFKFHFELKVKLPEAHFDLSHSRFWPLPLRKPQNVKNRTEVSFPFSFLIDEPFPPVNHNYFCHV
jgi:hypothetical protein